MTQPDWEWLLASWLAELDVGAEIEVRDPDGALALLVPLARHYRMEPEEGLLWIRPVVGGYEPRGPGMPRYAFHLNEARARAISTHAARTDGDEIVLETAGGQIAHIRPAGPHTRPELEHWDTFCYVVLTAEEEAALDAVWGDSYYGDWA